jgi:hypothetical protein
MDISCITTPVRIDAEHEANCGGELALNTTRASGPYLDLMPWTGGDRMGTVAGIKSTI